MADELLSAAQVAAIVQNAAEWGHPCYIAESCDAPLQVLAEQDARWRAWVTHSLLPAWRSVDSEPMTGPMHRAMQELAALLGDDLG